MSVKSVARLWFVSAMLLAAAACAPTPGIPGSVPPVPTVGPTSVPATTTPPAPSLEPTKPPVPVPPTQTVIPIPPAPAASACVVPAGMTKLIDQDPSDEQLPWKWSGVDRVVIYFAAPGVSAEWLGDLNYGSVQWNKSPCLDTRVVDKCPAGANCVTVSVVKKGDDGNFDAVEKGGYTVGGHIDLLDKLSTNEKKNVAVHEMGHAVGLVHRKARVLMNGDTYDDVFDPDPIEYQNLLFDYGRQAPGAAIRDRQGR